MYFSPRNLHLKIMTISPEIKLMVGFSALPFGSDKDLAIQVFGPAQETQVLTDDILGNNTLVYHYWDQGFSLFFDMNHNNSFSSVEIDNKDTILFDTKIFSLNEKELIALMKTNGHPLSDTEVHNWGEKRLSFDDVELDCYFENNKLVSVNFGRHSEKSEFKYFPN